MNSKPGRPGLKFSDHFEPVTPTAPTKKTAANCPAAVFKEKPQSRAPLVAKLGQALAEHYVGAASILRLGGLRKAAALVEASTPTVSRTKTRSGDFGEMLATEYINSETPYSVPFNKLQWKSDREMPMHGNDVIGMNRAVRPVQVLKGEIKSRISFTPTVMTEAVEALDDHSGRPNPSTLGFVVKRLFEMRRDDEAKAYSNLLTHSSLRPSQIEHHVFVVCGNDPSKTLGKLPKPKRAGIRRSAAAVVVDEHQKLIADVFRAALNGK